VPAIRAAKERKKWRGSPTKRLGVRIPVASRPDARALRPLTYHRRPTMHRRMRWVVGVLVVSCVLFACGGDDASNGTKSGGGSGGGAASGGAGSGGTSGTGASGGTGGSGGASGCSSASECPAPASECSQAACKNGACGEEPVASGTPVSSQTAGDCQIEVCDGAGSTQTANDDTDIPDDGDPCTTDTCNAGAPQNTPLAVGTACNGAGYCDAQGACVACLVDSDCGTATDCATPTCVSGACSTSFVADGTATSTQTAGDCKAEVCDGSGGVKTQDDDGDVPDDNNVCTTDSCSAGVASHVPSAGASCGTGVCDSSGQCVGCTAPSDCPGTDDFCKTRTCASNVCGFSFTANGTALPAAQQTAGDCKTLACDGSGNAASSAAPSDVPVDGNECTSDVCTGSTPSNPPKSTGTSCAGGVCNGAGACVGCITAADCGTPSGYPCVTATCTSSTCGTSNAAANTPCGGGTCSGGVATLQDKCDGAGACIDGGTQSCAPYVCGPSSCTSSCASDAGCAGGYACDTALAKCTNGPKCTDYCNTITANCTGSNQMYFSAQACVASCADLPKGAVSDTAGNSVGCRGYHAGLAAGDPVTHCPHASPAGAGVCGANCEGFCSIALLACTGAQQVYSSMSQCLTECGTFPTSPPYDASVTSGNSFACRMYHLTAATLDPATHCAHIGASSPVCQ
jgi:hypothetical protein